MKSLAICYFSGTGNTAWVAKQIETTFQIQGYQVASFSMEDVLKSETKLDLKNFDLIGFGSPVIGFGAPTIVTEFIRKLPKLENQKAFVFRTAGGVAPINYDASRGMLKDLENRGYKVFHERIFAIGSNWIVRYEDAVMKALQEATKLKVNQMCVQIISGEQRELIAPVKIRLIMRLLTPMATILLRLTGKDLTVDRSCGLCKKCIQHCPASNIYEKQGAIRFKWSCNGCMRCVYSCPQKALHHSKLAFFDVAGGYDLGRILENPVDLPVAKNIKRPPFFDHYVSNDDL